MEASADAVLRLVDAVGSAAERFAQLEDRILVDTGFTGARMRIAAVLAPDATRTAPQIARSLGLTRQAVHRTIGQICEKGLFEMRPDPADGRGSIIVLTCPCMMAVISPAMSP